MNFKAYYICEMIDSDLKKVNLDDEFFKKLNAYDRVYEGTQMYQPLYAHTYQNLILATLVQSYDTILTKFPDRIDENGEIVLGDTKINDKQFFYIDLESSIIYIQNKRYPSRTLNKAESRLRIEQILYRCTNKAITLVPANVNYTVGQLIEIFQHSYVKNIIFKNLKGIELPAGSVIHNPREDLDEAVGESWNYYSKNTIDYMEFHASDDEKLNSNPLVKLGLKLAEVGNSEGKEVLNKMILIDGGEKIEVKPRGNNNKIVYVPKDDMEDSHKTYDRILKVNLRNYQGRLEE